MIPSSIWAPNLDSCLIEAGCTLILHPKQTLLLVSFTLVPLSAGWPEGAILSQWTAGWPGRLQGDSCFAVCGPELQWCSVQEAARVPETSQRGSDPESGVADPQSAEAELWLGGQQLVPHHPGNLPAGPPWKGTLSHESSSFGSVEQVSDLLLHQWCH